MKEFKITQPLITISNDFLLELLGKTIEQLIPKVTADTLN